MKRGLIISIALTGLVWGQLAPTGFRLQKAVIGSFVTSAADSTTTGLASNSILDIQAGGDSLLYFGTSRGLSYTPDRGRTFRHYVADGGNLPAGGVSALNQVDSIIAAAGLADTVVNGEEWPKGTGLAYSTDLGGTWTYLEQPQEDSSIDTTFQWSGITIRQLAVTTDIANATYDMAVSEGKIWTASWAGGLRRYTLATGLWFRVPLPRDDDTTLSFLAIPEGYELNSRDPGDGGNHNHKAFSVIAYDSLVWAGTADGINKGIIDDATGSITWTHYKAEWGSRTISGNWVVALHRQVRSNGTDRIWAATVAANAGERQGVSFTEDNGETWYVTLLGERANNITSVGDVVYVATNNGLYKSSDGLNWARFGSAIDQLTGEQVWAEAAYGALYDSRDSTLWIGTPDGLARTRDDGLTWAIDRSYVSTTTQGETRFYAYPNPFYLAESNYRDGSGHVRFQYHIAAGEIETINSAQISIYDFAMDPVASLTREHEISGDFSQVWDGRNDTGHQVANGVYYCRLTLGQSEYWTKVIVIK